MSNPNWDIFVTPGIPIVTHDKPPGVHETFFQATASTLIYGVRDAVLVDAFAAWLFRNEDGLNGAFRSAAASRDVILLQTDLLF